MLETLSLDDIEALACDTLTRADVAAHAARSVAAEVAAAEAAADHPNGLAALLRDLRLLRYGHIRAEADITCTTARPGCLVVDAGHGFAAAALDHALPRLAALARAQGVAALTLHRASSPGAMRAARHRIGAMGLACLSAHTGTDPAPPAPIEDDDPFAGPVDHRAVLVVGEAALADAAPPAPGDPGPRPAPIAISRALLEQILAA